MSESTSCGTCNSREHTRHETWTQMTSTNFVKAFSRFSIDRCRKQSRVRDDPMSFVPPTYTK